MKSRRKPQPTRKRRSDVLVNRPNPDQTPEAATAEMIVEGLGTNAVTAANYSHLGFPFCPPDQEPYTLRPLRTARFLRRTFF